MNNSIDKHPRLLVSPVESSPDISEFDSKFWIDTLRELGYPLKVIELDLSALKEQKALPSDSDPCKVSRLYFDDYVEIALVEFDSTDKLRRSFCTRAARSWKANRLIKPLLCFTNGIDSFAVIVPGKGIGGVAKVLGLSDRLYRTDHDVLESIKYPGDAEKLNKCYDAVFFPYQKVRDEFFKGYSELYQRVEKAVNKVLKGESTSYAQRFLGRLMFLYFLQKKGWLKEDTQFIDTIKNYTELNKLFYESLNREGTPGIPFLNGSLFEKEDYMSAKMQNRLFPKLDRLFKDAREFFNDYNFTVDETSPLEVEVSIDPALIGTVFENMLPEYERGSKGTFYTPRVETSFICRRALTNFLGLNDDISPDSKTFHDGLSKYIEELKKTKSKKDVRAFREKLLSLRILDPAVGSGGFLLVMMQEIVALIQEAEATVGWKSDVEQYKKRILSNLYGFDIEPEAIEIACLRLWLSLIIDQREPEPLPNLDMRIIVINDTLIQPDYQRTLDTRVEELRERFVEVNARYLNEHYSRNKRKLKERLQEISKEIAKKTGVDPNVIEAYMPKRADIIVMNPPYVRQESIPKEKKDYYVERYSMSKKSDLFAYFLVRVLRLLSDNGIASVICSDKWLETGYGESLQEKLKDRLIAIYGQRERTFGADINTVITVYGNKKSTTPVPFTYLKSYGQSEVRQYIVIMRKDLIPGKWFYLRDGALYFLEKILPRLTHKLEEFTDIRFGIKTGANKFFYMKDVSHLYEVDHLSDHKKFEDWGVNARTKTDLDKQGLIYIENEGKERFVVDRKDVTSIIRSPKQLRKYRMTVPTTLCLYVDEPGDVTSRYLEYGKQNDLPSRPTLRNRKPWFKLADLKPTNILLLKSLMDILYIPFSEDPVICDNRLYALACGKPLEVWMYLNSTVFLMTIELFCRRLGGGGGASDIMVEDYKIMPVPNLEKLHIGCDPETLLKREALIYFDEVKQEDRKALDIAVLKAMGFDSPEKLLPNLYAALINAVDDRLIKADRPLKRNRENNSEEI